MLLLQLVICSIPFRCSLSVYFHPPLFIPWFFSNLFFFRNMWDSNTLFLWVYSSSFQCIGLKVSREFSCFVLDCTALWYLVNHYFNPTLSESCVIISVISSGCSSCICINNMYASRCSAPWYFNWDIATAYLEPIMLVIWSCFVWNFTLEELRTPGVSFGSSGCMYSWTLWRAMIFSFLFYSGSFL